MSYDIHDVLRRSEQNYVYGSSKIGDYVDWSMHDTVQKEISYLNSRHISGSRDSLGREKPFFNIVTAAVNIWYRATDLDRKDVNIKASKAEHMVLAFVMTILLRNWMKTSNFGIFLNKWGRELARHGSAVVEFIEVGGELIPSVLPWTKLIPDPVRFDSIPTIKIIHATPEDLRTNKQYDQDVVKDFLEKVMPKETRETQMGQKVDNADNFIKLYEIHGNMPISAYKKAKNEKVEDKDELEFIQQMHVIAYQKSNTDKYDNFTLFVGREKKHPQMITHLIEEEGRTKSIGAVEYLFDAQWMQNHSMKNMKDHLDLASRLIFQTSDVRFQGRNVLTAIETGQIMVHKPNEPVTQFPNSSHDVSAHIAFKNEWSQLATEITSTPDAIRGNTLPSGTPYSLAAYLGTQANSLFEVMTENKGLYLEQMLREYILPFLKKKMNSSDEISAILEEHDIQKLDAMYVPREAVRRFNTRAVDELFEAAENPDAPIPSPFQQEFEEEGIKNELSVLGNERFLKPSDIKTKTWKKALEGFEEIIDINITNEDQDKRVVLETLSSILQVALANPDGFRNNPQARLVFNKLLGQINAVSPVELAVSGSPAQNPQLQSIEKPLT